MKHTQNLHKLNRARNRVYQKLTDIERKLDYILRRLQEDDPRMPSEPL